MSALPGNPNYTSEDGVLFNKDKTRLVIYPDGKQGDYVIPNTVTAVAAGAFNDSVGLTSVTVPESVKNMDDAFCGCENLHTMLEVVNGYTNEIHAVSNGFLTNMASIVCDWEQIFRNETKSTVKLFSSIINDNTIINFSDKYISLFEVEEWVNWHKEFLEDEKRHNKDGHNFNVFFLMRDELGFHIQETKHDRLFMFLLDTHASHGQENMFLHEFLKILEIEEHDKGFWNIGKKGNMDILLQREQPHSIIIIENKSNWAGDQANQLYRYWYETIYQSTKKEYEKNKNFYSENKNKYQILYLAPNDKQYTTQTISISEQLKSEDLPDTIPMEIKYFPFNVDNQGVQKWLDNCIQSLNEKNHRIREYLTQYKMLCKTL